VEQVRLAFRRARLRRGASGAPPSRRRRGFSDHTDAHEYMHTHAHQRTRQQQLRRIQPFLSGHTRWEVLQRVKVGPRAEADGRAGDAAVSSAGDEDDEGVMPVFDWAAGGLTLGPRKADRGAEDGEDGRLLREFGEGEEEADTLNGLVKPTAEDFRTILEAEPDPGWITGDIDLSGLKNLRGYDGRNDDGR